MIERKKPTPRDVLFHLDEAAIGIAYAKTALFPESLASVPDVALLRRQLRMARRSIEFAEAMAKELEE